MTVENELDSTLPDQSIASDTGTDTTDAEMGSAYDRIMSDGSARDESGRFVGKEAGSAETASLEGEDGAGATADPSTVSVGTPAPAHLPQAIKADWDKIPEAARNAIAQHQSEMDRKFGEIGRQFNAVKPVADKLFEAVSKFPDFQGMTPDRLAQGALELAAVQVRLERAPLDTILEIAQQYGVLAPLQQKLSGQQVTAQAGPNVSALERKIAELESQFSEKASPDYIRQQVNAISEEQQAVAAVHSFAQSKEHWAEVQPRLAMFFNMALEDNPTATENEALELAYDMAVNAIPTVREKIRASEARTAATVDDLSAKRTEAARKAASVNVKPTVAGKARAMSEDDALAAAYDRAVNS